MATLYIPLGYPVSDSLLETPEASATLTDLEWLIWSEALSYHTVLEIADSFHEQLGHLLAPPKTVIERVLRDMARVGLVRIIEDDDPLVLLEIVGHDRWLPSPDGVTPLRDAENSEELLSDAVIRALHEASPQYSSIQQIVQHVASEFLVPEAEVAESLRELLLEGVGILGYLIPPLPIEKPRKPSRVAKPAPQHEYPLLDLLESMTVAPTTEAPKSVSYTAVAIEDWNAVFNF